MKYWIRYSQGGGVEGIFVVFCGREFCGREFWWYYVVESFGGELWQEVLTVNLGGVF